MKRISALATTSGHEVSTSIDWGLVRSKVEDSRRNDRRREIHTFHDGNDDPVHRMLNAMQPGTYVPPHRHATVPKSETVLVLQGRIAALCFEDSGAIDWQHSHLIGTDLRQFGVDVRAGIWHTFLVLEPDTVVLEVKPGPYAAELDKDFAPWAPSDSDSEASAYLRSLEKQVESRWPEGTAGGHGASAS